ncbi:MAG TPA: hypothetical protein VHJ83_16425 [Micromonosporaceae bacterium]|nr:hypothetical protein [Micromonosporaceae bacterium]
MNLEILADLDPSGQPQFQQDGSGQAEVEDPPVQVVAAGFVGVGDQEQLGTQWQAASACAAPIQRDSSEGLQSGLKAGDAV